MLPTTLLVEGSLEIYVTQTTPPPSAEERELCANKTPRMKANDRNLYFRDTASIGVHLCRASGNFESALSHVLQVSNTVWYIQVAFMEAKNDSHEDSSERLLSRNSLLSWK